MPVGRRLADDVSVEGPDERVAALIALGRDREAAALADGGAKMDVASQLARLGPLLAGVVESIGPAELDRPTPCTDFSVRGVLEHMVAGATQFAAAFRREDAVAPDLADPLAGFGPALTELAGAITSPGALDGTMASPFGEVPAETFARFVVLDGLVHGWDLATATGQAYDPDPALVAEVAAFAADALPPLRDGVSFGPKAPAPDGASPIEALAAFTGRIVPA